MSERYFITGVQLGTIKAFARDNDVNELIESIIDDQFIGQMMMPYKDYEIIIKKKEMSK